MLRQWEGAPQLSQLQRARWPIGDDGGGVKRVFITQDDGSGNPQWFAAENAMSQTMVVNTKSDGTGREYTVYLRYESGVWFTGQSLLIVKKFDEYANDSVWQPVAGTRGEWPAAIADGDIVSTGYARIDYISHIISGGGTITVPVTMKGITFNVTDGTGLMVSFDQRTRTFYGYAPDCPAVV